MLEMLENNKLENLLKIYLFVFSNFALRHDINEFLTFSCDSALILIITVISDCNVIPVWYIS